MDFKTNLWIAIALWSLTPFVSLAQIPPTPESSPNVNIQGTDPNLSQESIEGGEWFGEILDETLKTCQLEPQYLQPETQNLMIEEGIITGETIIGTTFNNPSLWWAREQFGRGKLVRNWLAFTKRRRIDLIVNRQLWSQMNYLEQYSFVHRFGTVARQYGYDLRVFNQQPKCLALYICDYRQETPQCRIDLQPSGRDPFNPF